MASQNRQYFDGSTSITDAHNIHTEGGNIMWPNECSTNVEGSEKRIVEALLWLFHTLGLCCAIAGEFAMYISGKLVCRPGSISIYIACHPQNWSSDISVLLKIHRTSAFSLDSLDILFFPECSIPSKMLHYVIRYGVEITFLGIL